MTPKRHVVTNFRIRPPTFPDGHWMNRFWGPLARSVLWLAQFPFYRFVPRMEPGVRDLLASGHPVIFTCTHQDILDCFNGLPRVFQDRKMAAMVSYSRDGNLAAMALQMLGYEVVRGSSSRGGGEGLLMLRTTLTAGGSVILVCDGPKAPLGDVKPGVVYLAARSGVPIVPLRAWGLNRLRFERSWTKAAITIPFLPVVLCFGDPIHVPHPMGDAFRHQVRIAESLARLARAASTWAGGPARAPFTVNSPE